MKTLLVIADQSGLAEAIRVALAAGHYQVLCQSEIHPGDPLLARGRIDACIIDADLTNIRPIRAIETVVRALPSCPIIIYASSKQWEWEEEAYLLGATHILSKPVRGPLLNNLLQRLPTSAPRAVATRPAPAFTSPSENETRTPQPARLPQKALEVFRNFSALLPHGLSTEALLREFLLQLRETVGVNRAAIFLRPATEIAAEHAAPGEARRLRSACAIGLPPELLRQFALTLDFGVGGQIAREGRILRRDSDTVQNDPASRLEFELLGAEVALPILDRETFTGVAFFDRRVTGEALTNEELSLIFYLLEGLGLAIKNIRLYEEVTTNQGMMGDILRQLKSGCIVVSRDLSVQHANKTALDFFLPGRAEHTPLQFRDLPQFLGGKIFETLQSGVAAAPFRYSPPNAGQNIYQIVIAPFLKHKGNSPSAALVLIEDCTQSERLQHIEIEAANLRMIKTMAERLAHEIGNALVPLSTHQQLLASNYQDAEFRASLETAMVDGVKRIARLGQQMLFLAQERPATTEPISVSKLIEDAFSEAQKNHGEQPVVLQYDTGGLPLTLTGDRAGLKHALAEVMLNALQANAPSPRVKVDTRENADAKGGHWLCIEVMDSGTGFTAESSRKAPEPFFTTRNVGLGLGLTVTRKIIEMHHGHIEIASPNEGKSGRVTITLPLDAG